MSRTHKDIRKPGPEYIMSRHARLHKPSRGDARTFFCDNATDCAEKVREMPAPEESGATTGASKNTGLKFEDVGEQVVRIMAQLNILPDEPKSGAEPRKEMEKS